MLTMDVITALLVMSTLCMQQAIAQIVDLNILPAGTKKAGDHVTVECSVMPYVLHDTLRLSLVTKGMEREICTNMVLSNLFASSSRYEVKMAQDGDKVTLTLDITDVNAGDSGNFICKHTSGKTAQETIIVYVPVKSVTLLEKVTINTITGKPAETSSDKDTVTKTQTIEGGVINVREGVTSVVICDVKVEGGQQEPDVHVYWGSNDILKQHCQHQLNTNNVTTDVGTQRRDYDVTYTCNISSPRPADHGRDLSCVAFMPEVAETAVSVNIEVSYAPKLFCKKVTHAKLRAKNFVVSCRVTMWPNATGGWWTWRDTNGDDMRMPLRAETDNKTANIEEHSLPQHTVVTLMFDEITSDTFTNYTLTIENTAGKASATIQLTEDTGNVVEEPEPTQLVDIIVRNPGVVQGHNAANQVSQTIMCSVMSFLVALVMTSLFRPICHH